MRAKELWSKITLVFLLAALVAVLVVTPASASQSIFDFLGSTGSGAGQFAVGFERPADTLLAGKENEPGAAGIAVSDSTGDVYVVDRSNNRVEQFDSEDHFIRAWGVDVISGGATGAGNVIKGSTTVSAVLTTSRAFIAGQEISGAGIAAGTKIVKVTSAAGAGSKLTLSQKAEETGTGVALTAAEGTGNVPQNEKQELAISASSGDFKLAFNTTVPSLEATTGNLAFNASAETVEAALKALPNIGAGNVAVAGPEGGPYAIEFKGTRFADTNVAQLKVVEGSPPLAAPGKTLITTTQEGAGRFEKCTEATICQAGTASGIIGGMATPNGIVIEQSTGNVYVSDQFNLRVDEFDSSGTPIRAFGGNVVQSGPDNKPEVQKLTVNADSGTFTLSFEGNTTAPLPFKVKASGGVGPEASVENALNALTSIGKSFGSVSVSEEGTGPNATVYTVTFGGALANKDVSEIELNANGLGAPVGTELPCQAKEEGADPPQGTVTYQWLRNGEEISSATASTYTTVAADEGKLIQCKVKIDNGQAADVRASRANGSIAGSVYAVAVSPYPGVTPPQPPFSVSIAPFNAHVGQTLTCNPGIWGPGSPAPTFAYRWLRNGTPIGGATANTYLTEAADNQTAIQCEVSGTNAGGTAIVDSFSVVIHSFPPTNAGTPATAPTISGTAAVGSELSCANGTWQGATSFAYQWLRNGEEIGSATASTYTTVPADEGTAIQCKVTATNSEGSSSAVSGNEVIAPVPSPGPPSGSASTSGERRVGQTLTCQTNTGAPTFTYKWLRNGAEIAGKTVSTYTTVTADLNKLIQCQITVTNGGGASVAVSAPSEGGGPAVVSNREPGSSSTVISPSHAKTTTDGAKVEICSGGSDVCRSGTSGEAGGIFSEDTTDAFDAKFEGYVAVAPGGPYAGDVFVGDDANSRIQIFDPSGTFVGTFGWKVLQSGPETADKNICLASLGDVCKAGAVTRNLNDGPVAPNTYGFARPFRTKYEPPVRLAIGPDGAIYVPDLGALQKYTPDLTSEHDFATGLCSKEADVQFCEDVAVDPNSGDVYVAFPIVGEEEICVPQGCFKRPVPKEAGIARYDAAGDEPPLETDLEGAEVRPVNGMAIDGSVGNERSGRLYFSTAKPEQRIDVLGEPAPPDVQLDKVDPEKVTPHSATLTGTINPNGNKIHTVYRFETLVQGGIWTQYPVPNEDVGNGSSPVVIETTIPGLLANTEYHVRLTALKGNRVTTPEQTFTTPQAGPVVETGEAQWSGPAETKPSLIFTGQIDDNNQEAHYYFQYGPDASYGKRVPFFETGTHPASQEAFTARQTVPGLDPAGTYHYRLVARTPSGTTIGEDREVGPAEAGRRYPELVSPAEKGPGVIGTFIGFTDRQLYWQAAANGNRMSYGLESGTLGATAGGEVINLGSRDPLAGWRTSQLTPPSLVPPPAEGLEGANTGFIKWQSPELTCGFVESQEPLTPDVTETEVKERINNLFLHDYTTDTYVKISAQHLDSGAGEFSVAGASDDCNRVVFESQSRLLPGLLAGNNFHLYEWEDTGEPNGTLRSADILPDETVASSAVFGSPSGGASLYTNAVAEPDASHVFFGANGALFVRKNHATTTEYSKSQTATPNSGELTYQMASSDGSHVFFTARAGLAANGSSSGAAGCAPGGGQGCDLYDYDVESGLLTDLTPDANPADKQGADVTGVLGASDGGSYVYFAAKGQLIPGEGRTFNQNSGEFNNIYLAHEGALSFVGSVSKMRNGEERLQVERPNQHTSRVTPDGRYLIFISELNLTGYESEGAKEIYRYSEPEEGLECVTCRADGLPPQLKGERTNMIPSAGPEPYNTNEPRNISADGSRIFFNSAEALAPGAIEGDPHGTDLGEWHHGSNAYEWHNGTIHLLAAQARFTDASASGDDVFVITDERLVPQDQDGAPDIYDLRVDGGFPYSPPEPCDPLTENSCQGTPPPPPPPTPDPASARANGPGNPPVAALHNRKPKKHHRKKHKSHKHKSHKRAAKRNRGGVK
jgi:hypothetical protein